MTDQIPPLPWKWDGEALTPLNQHWSRRADASLVIGETYVLVPEHNRSAKSHNHQFAEIGEAWKTLPEHLSARFPTAEALRRHALIKAGFATVTEHVTGSNAEALRLAAVITGLDPYSVVEVKRSVVAHYRAMSQSLRAMGAKEFQRSKTACLEVVAEMLAVSPESLRTQAREAA